MKKYVAFTVLCLLFCLISTPSISFAVEVNSSTAAAVSYPADDTMCGVSDPDLPAADSLAEPVQATDFQQVLLDKLDVIIYLLAIISAAGLFLLISLIIRLFGWIFANIFKEIY